MFNTIYRFKIGLESHFWLNTRHKLFCRCINWIQEWSFRMQINDRNICIICLGFPGTMPYLNDQVLDKIVTLFFIFKEDINYTLSFDWKSYIYYDVPKNFQITQSTNPIIKDKVLKLYNDKSIWIKQIHVEEDAAKSMHVDDKTFINFEWSGSPLIEIVTWPDFTSIKGVVEYLLLIRLILKRFNLCNLDLAKGDFWSDVNISMQVYWLNKSVYQGPRIELKNINSIIEIKKAIAYEMEHLKSCFDNNIHLQSCTKGWNKIKQRTFFLRKKEQAFEYKLITEADLPLIYLKDVLNTYSWYKLNWLRSINFIKYYNDIWSYYINQKYVYQDFYNIVFSKCAMYNVYIRCIIIIIRNKSTHKLLRWFHTFWSEFEQRRIHWYFLWTTPHTLLTIIHFFTLYNDRTHSCNRSLMWMLDDDACINNIFFSIFKKTFYVFDKFNDASIIKRLYKQYVCMYQDQNHLIIKIIDDLCYNYHILSSFNHIKTFINVHYKNKNI